MNYVKIIKKMAKTLAGLYHIINEILKLAVNLDASELTR